MAGNANLVTHVLVAADCAGGKPFLVEPDGTAISFADLDTLTGRYAARLAALGGEVGDRIVVQVDKSPEAVLLYLAALRLGMVFVPLNTAYTSAELDYFIGDAEPAIVVCRPGDETEIGGRTGARVVSLGERGDGSLLEHLPEGGVPVVAREPSDLACILYTSGTTGRSKGAMLTHANLLSNARTLLAAWRWTADDVLIHILPIFHVHGLFVALHCALLAPATIRFHRGFDPAAVVADFARSTVLMGVPTHYVRLLSGALLSREACAPMRLFISGSAPLLAETHRAFTEVSGQAILERYGMTETGMITSNPYDGERVPGTVGYALSDISVRICAEGGARVDPGEPGVLEVRGPNVFAGYWRNPEKTAEEFRADGFFITGDIATASPDGRVTLVGRAKDLIISGGLNIYPKEIEEAIDELEGVTESAVIGVPHPDFGEAVVAVVVGSAGADRIAAGLDGKLARFKQPKRIVLVDDLPRNTMGKVQKARLRELYADSFPVAAG
ncbi:AMP-binding protein [Sphingopyxis sp. H050]|jgi:malonyl-CoA/methylmalonyl-CoA synthetase|uniref:AMP-binding protein n=1 Tax=Sphingopyxis sp. H050 TaxID=1759072 RepID=UPI0009E95EEA|nr:AMP-binding protein [Sphingopyxis sp. H050]